MFTRFFSFLSKPKIKELDEFDKRFGFMLKYKIVTKKSYDSVKFYFFSESEIIPIIISLFRGKYSSINLSLNSFF
jgi:hypothetical protein